MEMIAIFLPTKKASSENIIFKRPFPWTPEYQPIVKFPEWIAEVR